MKTGTMSRARPRWQIVQRGEAATAQDAMTAYERKMIIEVASVTAKKLIDG